VKHSHVHFNVRDLAEAVRWFKVVWALPPAFQNEKMAMFPLGEFSLIVDAADEDSRATIAFASDNCERDFRNVRERGAEVIAPPTKTGWGVIAAYLKGPGGLTVEIEEPTSKESQ
jgi:predicted enzyme related to lactoylglutathione lyase